MRGDNKILKSGTPLAQLLCFAVLFSAPICFGQEATPSERTTTEPVFRISKLNTAETNAAAEAEPSYSPEPIAAEPTSTAHPLDKAIEMAKVALRDMQAEVQDYTCILVKREQVNGVIGEKTCMNLKIRCPRDSAAGPVPFSIYLKFLTPRACSGREVIWVDGQNENKLIAHEGRGIAAMKRFYLDPTGWLAMKDNRYPVYDAG